ncbi:MAG TPA: UDP-N-acetylmuramate dehydrogenase [Pseudolysinimonas sp.]|nr:UDP-N-acetylmuramate dehydrogenase [Pseudolysinimonas sp.]
MTDRGAASLASLTTIGVGGPAERLVEVATVEELVAAAEAAWSDTDDWLILGGGSNLLVSDDGFAGTVIRIVTRGIERSETTLRVQAGEAWDDVVATAVDSGLAGIEALSGIPGTAGAAPIQNIGAYGQQLGDTLLAIEFLDFESGELLRLTAAELELGYRTSSLKQGRLGVVVSIELALADAGGMSSPIAYAQLASALGVSIGDRVPLAAARAAVLELRAAKGMLWNPADPDSVSAGSFFTNPIVSEGFARGLPAELPRYPTEPEPAARILPLGTDVDRAGIPASGAQRVKLSAAWLIEHSGVPRGFALPGSRAAVSSKHTLALTNRGGALATEIVQLATYVQTRVMSEFGVLLHPEPVLIGLEI